MPVSRSPSPAAKPARGAPSPARGAPLPARAARSIWPWILIGVAGVIAVVVIALPASVVTRLLPAEIQAEDFSGSLWHGSAGKISFNGRDAGALEWRLHPAALLRMSLSADVHWVKGGFVIDGAGMVSRQGYALRDISGGGPIEDLGDFGVAKGWRGNAGIKLSKLEGGFAKPGTAEGEIALSNLASAQVADGVDLGNYELRLPAGAVSADGSINAQLRDTAGPVETQAQLQLLPAEHRGLLTGTVKERSDAPPALRSQLANLSQLRPRDSQGRIPVELEFTF